MKKEVYVIRDNQNNFTHSNSITKIDENLYRYISFKTFDPACRAYETLETAKNALLKLIKKKNKIGNLSFFIDKINLSEAIEDYKNYKDNNFLIKEYYTNPIFSFPTYLNTVFIKDKKLIT